MSEKNIPIFSIIITNYNYGKFIEEAILSVIKQKFQEWELIIVDDGSTDNSRDIIEKYIEQYPEKIRAVYKQNGGQYSAFYEGYIISRGTYIALLDSDDYYYPEMIQRKYEMHIKYPKSGMCDTAITADGLTVFAEKSADLNYHNLYTEYGYYYHMGTTSSLSFSRSVLGEILPIRGGENFVGGVDSMLGRMALAITEVAVDNRISGYYRIHDNHVKKEHYLWNNDPVWYTKYYYDIVEMVRKNLLDRFGYHILENDMAYYRYLVDDNINLLTDKRCVVYGISAITDSFIRILEEKQLMIVFLADNKKYRKNFQKNNTRYTCIDVNELPNLKSEYDIILIASRSSKQIINYFREIGIEESRYLVLPL